MQEEKRGKAGELRIKEERSGEEGESDWMVEGEQRGIRSQEARRKFEMDLIWFSHRPSAIKEN